MIYSGTYTVIKADVPEFFRRLKIVIIYKKYLYIYMTVIEKNNLKKLIMSAKIFKNTTKKKEEKVL